MRNLNVKLWEQVHSLELKIKIENNARKREEKQFRKKLVRLSKHLHINGHQPKQVRLALQEACEESVQTESEKNDSNLDLMEMSKVREASENDDEKGDE